MGIRIDRSLCFALGDVKTSKGFVLEDDRFQDWMLDLNSQEHYERPRRMRLPFLEWILDPTKRAEQLKILEEANGPSKFSDGFSITWGIECVAKRIFALPEKERDKKIEDMHFGFLDNFEYGGRHFFGIIPPEQDDFHRHDDIIDYYDHCRDPKIRIKWLDQRTGHSGIYPHTFMVRIPHTQPVEIRKEDLDYVRLSINIPEDAKAILPDRLDAGTYNRLVGLWDKNVQSILTPEAVKRCHSSYRPEIFASVLLWTHYVGLFKDWAKTVNQLRPCLYTYWG